VVGFLSVLGLGFMNSISHWYMITCFLVLVMMHLIVNVYIEWLGLFNDSVYRTQLLDS
jgi:hypothetical protein